MIIYRQKTQPSDANLILCKTKVMKKAFFLILAIAISAGCSNSDDNNTPQLKIRLSNISTFDFKNIVVNTSTGDVNFDDLNAGQQAEYKVFELAYRYAFVELQIDGKTYTLQPIDYLGEIPLENGNYTYEINANNSLLQYQRLSLFLVED